jgi:predicted thioesterase
METDSISDASSDPALTPFVTATPAEIAYAEQLLRQIEQQYLDRANQSATHSDASAD